jgi:hypothetical protein
MMPNSDKPPLYQTYLLTCWQERDEVAKTAVWRFRLETPRSSQRRAFNKLAEVMSPIETELEDKL